MGCVYRYIDKRDGIIKYVGIVWGQNRSLKRRIKEHEKDSNFAFTEWRIEYIDTNIDTRTDAEYFESHYIALYKTFNYLNNTKKQWGISKYLPNRESDWKEYGINKEPKRTNPYKEAYDYVEKILSLQTYEERRSLLQRIIKLSNYNDDNGEYYKKVRRCLDENLNIYLFGDSNGCAKFNGHGEIVLSIPLLGSVKYRDWDDTIIISKTNREVKRGELASQITFELDKIDSAMIHTRQ